SALESAAAFSPHDVARGGSGGNSVGIDDVWFDVRSPARRLGNAVGGALSDCPFWLRASAFYPAARCNAVFCFADGAHHACILLFPDVRRSLWGDLVPHADRAEWNPQADGAIANSLSLNPSAAAPQPNRNVSRKGAKAAKKKALSFRPKGEIFLRSLAFCSG